MRQVRFRGRKMLRRRLAVPAHRFPHIPVRALAPVQLISVFISATDFTVLSVQLISVFYQCN